MIRVLLLSLVSLAGWLAAADLAVSPLGVRPGGSDPVMPASDGRANLIENPGFDLGLESWGRLAVNGLTDGWRADPAGGIGGGSAGVYTRRKGVAQAMLASRPLLVEPGRDYTVSFSMRASQPKTSVFAVVQTGVWSEFPGKMWVRAGTDWQRHAFTFKAPNRFARVCFGDHWNSSLPTADGVQVWIDEVQMVAGSEPGAFAQDPVVCHSTTQVRDGVFLVGQPAPLRVVLANTTARTLPCTATIEVRDAFRTVLATRTISAELPPRGTTEEAIDLAATGATGLFSLRVRTACAGFSSESFARAAILSPIGRMPRLRYLYHTELPPGAEEAAWRLRLGYGGALGWTPPAPAMVPVYAQLGWRQIFSPTEAVDAPVKVFQQAMTSDDWTRYFAWLDLRTAPYAGLPVWCKTMNEPDVPRRTWTPEEHLGIVRHLRGTIGATPGTVLLTPEPVTTNRHGLDWLDRFLGLGGKDVVDAVATHTYRARPESPDLDADIQLLRALKAKHGIASKPICFTEGEGTPIYTVPEHKLSPFTGWADWRLGLLSLDVGPSETAAAALMVRTLLVCLKNDDVATYTTWGDDREDGQPLASLAAVNHLLGLLGQSVFTCERNLGDSARAYQFHTDRGPVAALWCHDLRVDLGEIARPLALVDAQGKELRITDLMGNVLPVDRQAGRLAFPLGGHPVFLSGALTAAELTRVLESATVGGKGVRAVDGQLRLAALDAATVTVANLLPRPVAGRLTVRVDGAEAAAADQTIAPGGEVSLAVPLSGAPGKLNAARIELAFAGANGEATTVVDDLRWFSIPALAQGGDAWWESVAPLRLDAAAAVVNGLSPWGGPADLSATWWLGWDGEGLRIHAEIADDVMQAATDVGNAWKADSLQIYLDLYGDGHRKEGAGYDSNDTTLVVAKVGGKDMVWRDLAPEWQVGFVKRGAVEGAQVRITRREAVTVYDLHLPVAAVFPIALKPGSAFGCALLVNDGDAPGVRKQSLTMTRPGTEPHRHPRLWPSAVLTGR